MITLGSLFDGSGGFPLASALYGAVPLWASEIEPYPIAVTQSRFPNMKHLGNIVHINGAEIDPVDIITFGSPCQDMSMAGKRAGMKHSNHGGGETTRSGLFYEAVRIIKEMRQATHGKHPTFAVWENVPGAFTSNNGQDFLCVLQTLVQAAGSGVSVPEPPHGRWTNAGEIVADGFSIAWRVLDAQYWGVPQRRRRIYLVADFAGQRAGKILFERQSVPRYFKAGRASWRETAPYSANGAGRSDSSSSLVFSLHDKSTRFQGGGSSRKNDGSANGLCISGENAMYTLTSADRHAVAFMAGQGAKARSVAASDRVSPTLKASPSGLNQVPSIIWPTTARTLTAQADASPCVDRGQNIVCYSQMRFGRFDIGTGTITTEPYNPSKTAFNLIVCPNTFHALTASNASNVESAQQPNCVAYTIDNPVVYDARGNGDGNTVPTLTGDHENWVTDYTDICIGNGQLHQTDMSDKTGALNCMHDQQAVIQAAPKPPRRYIVRRLMPVECARLQGFPDGWGKPDSKVSFSDAEYDFWQKVRTEFAKVNGRKYTPLKTKTLLNWYNKLHADSAEYKMWGNGIALPCAAFVISGCIQALEPDENSLISLVENAQRGTE